MKKKTEYYSWITLGSKVLNDKWILIEMQHEGTGEITYNGFNREKNTVYYDVSPEELTREKPEGEIYD